jgi:hypothetical protein
MAAVVFVLSLIVCIELGHRVEMVNGDYSLLLGGQFCSTESGVPCDRDGLRIESFPRDEVEGVLLVGMSISRCWMVWSVVAFLVSLISLLKNDVSLWLSRVVRAVAVVGFVGVWGELFASKKNSFFGLFEVVNESGVRVTRVVDMYHLNEVTVLMMGFVVVWGVVGFLRSRNEWS